MVGRARVSTKGVVTFSSLHDINRQALAEMITAIDAGPGGRPAHGALATRAD